MQVEQTQEQQVEKVDQSVVSEVPEVPEVVDNEGFTQVVKPKKGKHSVTPQISLENFKKLFRFT